MDRPARGIARPSAADPAAATQKTVGNPVIPGPYADPEAALFGDAYWIFATYSAPYDQQTFMDCFSSSDLATCEPLPCQATQTVPSEGSTATYGSVALVCAGGETCLVNPFSPAAATFEEGPRGSRSRWYHNGGQPGVSRVVS